MPVVCVERTDDFWSGTALLTLWCHSRGANPKIKDCWGNHDVLNLVERSGSKGVLEELREWGRRRRRRRRRRRWLRRETPKR